MKTKRIKTKRKALWVIFILFCIVWSTGCDDEKNDESHNPSLPVTFEKFSPEKGGSTTQLVITGSNFGNDVNLIKVKVGNREARVVGVSPTKIYAVIRARSVDVSGETDIEVSVAENPPYVFEKKFNYELTQMVSTFAGKGEQGQDDGDALSATFDSPTWLTFDSDGILYVLEEYGGLRAIDQAGNVTTLFTHNGLRKRSIDFSQNDDSLFLSVDQNGAENPPVYYLMRDNGFSNPRGFVRGVSANCNGMAVNPIDGYVFWTCWDNSNVYFCPPDQPSNSTEASCFALTNGTETLCAWSKDGKTYYRIIKTGHQITKISYDPISHQFIGSEAIFVGIRGQAGSDEGGIGVSKLNNPCQLTGDEDGNIFICDRDNHLIRKVTPEGHCTIYAGQIGKSGLLNGLPTKSLFNHPEGIAIDKDGAIYVADRDNRVIRKIVIE